MGNGVVDNIVTIKPSTVLAWHRKLAARKWTYRQKPKGRPATEDEVRNLVIEIKKNNRRWGARRIVGELRKVGKIISKSTVLNILKESGFPDRSRRRDESWYRFLRSHGTRFFACDFFDCRHRVFKTPLRICPYGLKDCPKFIVSDRDGIYGAWLGTFLKDCYDITLYRTPPGMPNCNAFIERLNRPHQSLDQDSPCKKHGKIDFDRTKIRREHWVDGLIVDYSIAA